MFLKLNSTTEKCVPDFPLKTKFLPSPIKDLPCDCVWRLKTYPVTWCYCWTNVTRHRIICWATWGVIVLDYPHCLQSSFWYWISNHTTHIQELRVQNQSNLQFPFYWLSTVGYLQWGCYKIGKHLEQIGETNVQSTTDNPQEPDRTIIWISSLEVCIGEKIPEFQSSNWKVK